MAVFSTAARLGASTFGQLPDEEQSSRLRQLFGGGASFVGGVGQILDLPGSTIRDIFTGNNPIDQWLHPLDPTRKITGREALRQWGAIGPENTWGNWAGALALEIGLDPLTWLSGGALAFSKLGKVGKSTELLKEAAKVAGERLGTGHPVLGIGKRQLRMLGTGDDYLEAARRLDASTLRPRNLAGSPSRSYMELLDRNAAQQLGLKNYQAGSMDAFRRLQQETGNSLGGLAAVGIPFGPQIPFGKGPIARTIGKGLDVTGQAVRVSPIGVAGARLLSAPARGAKTLFGQEHARMATETGEVIRADIRGATARLKQEWESIKGLAGEEISDRKYRELTELAEHVWTGMRGAIRTSDVLPPAAAAQMDQHLAKFHQMFQDELALGNITGVATPDFVDYSLRLAKHLEPNYATRYSRIAEAKGTPRGGRAADERVDILKGFVRGSEGVNELAAHPEVADAIDTLQELMQAAGTKGTAAGGIVARRIKQATNQAAEAIERNFGVNTLDPSVSRGSSLNPEGVARPQEHIVRYYQKYDAKGNPTGKMRDRYRDLSQWLARFSRDERMAGVFTNDPIQDMENHLIKTYWHHNQVRIAQKMLGNYAKPAGTYGDKGVRLGDVLKSKKHGLGLDKPRVSLNTIAEDLGIGGQIGPSPTQLKRLADYHVPEDLAAALRNNLKPTTPREKHWALEGYDSYMAWFKTMNTTLFSMPPLSAFAFRNHYAGQYHNWAHRVFSPGSYRDADTFMRQGWDSLKGTSKWETLQEEWTRRGGSLEAFTDADANRLLQEQVYAHDMYGPGREVSAAHTQADIMRETEPLQMQLPGTQPLDDFLTLNTLRQYAGQTPETSLNPLAVRGFGGRTQSEFGPVAVGERINTWVEGSNRLTPFFEQLKKGVSFKEAADKAKALQVDYSWRKYSAFEKEVLTRAFPFYKWTSRMLPWTIKSLIERPGGRVAQTIRTQRSLLEGQQDEYVPERARRGLAIRLPGFGPEGTTSYLTQLDLPHEGALAPLQLGYGDTPLRFLGSTMQRTMRGIGGMMAPTPKALIESATGQQLYTGRDLEKLDGGVARIYSNVGDIIESFTGRRPPDIPMLQETNKFENLLWSHIGSPLSKLRTITDTREGAGLDAWIKKAANLATGARIATFDEKQIRDIEAMQELITMLRGRPGLREFTKPYIRKEDLDKVSPQDRALLELLQSLRGR